ncbi:DUF4132 domain-containing protein [Dactylosporangium sp. NPDC051541]|uniref:DUF4132 domain-containing protein n=1 Tax=Dactylosporangium sp. NPDC051541 TaxID=3363977 RepID=UPI0037989ECB
MDEDVLELPVAWRRTIYPRRGGVPVRFSPHPASPGIVTALLRDRLEIRTSLQHPQTPPEVGAAGMAHLLEAADSTPLGAAAVAVVLLSRLSWREKEAPAAIAEAWVLERGLEFAVRAGVELAGLRYDTDEPSWRAVPTGQAVLRADPDAVTGNYSWLDVESLLARLRAGVAAAPDDVYGSLVGALAQYRSGGLHQRVATSFLAPTEPGWVDADARAVHAAGGDLWAAVLLAASASTAEQLELVAGQFPPYVMLDGQARCHSMIEGLGAAAVGPLVTWLDAEAAPARRQSILGLLAMLPSDAAFAALVERVEEPHVALEAAAAAARFPRRALRLLAGSDAGAALLRTHVRNHPELVDVVRPELSAAAAGRLDAVLDAIGAVPEVPVTSLPAELMRYRPPEQPMPGWADAASLPPIRMRDGSGVLPLAAARLVLGALRASGQPAARGALEAVKRVCEPRDVAEFAWVLLEGWRAGGMPGPESWTLAVQGVAGDDETARRLAPIIREWPGQSRHARAIEGLQVLARIGSDVALMQLHGIAQRAKFQGLKKNANRQMAAVAATLGLMAEQLADRLVPDFGLAPDGTLVLDYGQRRFVVGFDEELKPFVADEDGKRRKALPKPGAGDDQELAPAAYQRFTALKKEVRTVATDQVNRLERAMVEQRQWTGAEFRERLLEHPLLWHIVRRLVWAAGPGAFRVAEDRTLADADDKPVTIAGDAIVRVAHPVLLGDALPVWSAVFADYEILQPFAQLGRETFTLTGEADLRRFTGIAMPTGRVIGLERYGWRRGNIGDNGIQHTLTRPLPGGGRIEVGLDPGIAVGAVTVLPEQTFDAVKLISAGSGPDPVTASEVVRELTEVTR